MTADDPCHQDFYSPRELLFFDGSNLTNATEAYLPPVLPCLLSASDATEQLKQVISAALGLSFSAGDQLTVALLGAMRAALGAPTTMADDEVRRLVCMRACMHALATARARPAHAHARCAGLWASRMHACMHALATARERQAHACAHNCAPAHACAHPSPQVRELLISQGVLECSSRTTRVLTTRTTRDELFFEVHAALMSPDDEP
jgi:hypothetical protein